jgi:twinkle protein
LDLADIADFDINKAEKIQSGFATLDKWIGGFVLDNLMMIDLECSEYELNKRQKEFVLSLKTFARKFNAVVHLIAHPRKTEVVRRLTKMDVAGSGDITNLADYVISIHRVTQEEKQDKLTAKGEIIVPACPFDNIIDLFKNRPLGHQDKTIGLNFHYPSKRLYGQSDNLNKKYSWIKTWKPKLEGAVEVEEKCPWD